MDKRTKERVELCGNAKDARASQQCRPEVLARTSLELQKGKDKQRYYHDIALLLQVPKYLYDDNIIASIDSRFE